MSDKPDKNDTIAKAYNEFYGSVKDAYNLAKKVDKSITLADVKKWFDGNFARKTCGASTAMSPSRPTRNARSISYLCQKPTARSIDKP